MNKRVIIFFAVVILMTVSLVFYVITKEIPNNEYEINGEYDIWTTESIETEIFSQATTSLVSTDTVPVQTELSSVYYTQIQNVFVNLNTASIEELMLLDGVGEVIAGNILNYRISSGGFKNIEEIMNVKGIGEKTFEKIKEHIYVENPVYQPDPTEAVIPTETEASPIDPVQTTEMIETAPPIMKFNLNTVTLEELLTIPQIDTAIAESIISLRTNIKYFSNVRELLYVDGMTEEKLLSIMDYFYI